MAKIGRNEICPCGSGKKFKRCCLGKEQSEAVAPPRQLSLSGEIEQLQDAAVRKQPQIRELGVFILFSTAEGDAWLLEVTQSDALQVAAGGEKVDVELTENPETIEINWSHTFAFRDKKFETTSYRDKKVTGHPDYPSAQLNAACRRIIRKYTPEQLDQVHIAETRQ